MGQEHSDSHITAQKVHLGTFHSIYIRTVSSQHLLSADLLDLLELVYGRFGQSNTCTVLSISAQISQEGIEYTRAKVLLSTQCTVELLP